MNKQQREYAIERVRGIANSKTVKCACEKPSIRKHIRMAIFSGTAKVKPAKQIIDFFDKKIMESRYGDPDADLEDIFVAPQSYLEAEAEMKAEQAKHDAEDKATLAFAQSIVDRIELGEFEDGKDAIREMEAYQPKPVKK